MVKKDVKYHKNLVDKAITGFEKIDSNLERNSTVGEILSNNTVCHREIPL